VFLWIPKVKKLTISIDFDPEKHPFRSEKRIMGWNAVWLVPPGDY
jgi:hypothetical protein